MTQYLHNATDPPAIPTDVRPNIWLLSSEELPPLLFTAEQAAQLLGVGRDAVYGLIRCRRLRSVKVGNSRRVSARALADCVSLLEQESA